MSGRCGGGRRRNLARAKQRVEDCSVVIDIRQLLPDGRAVEGNGIVRVGPHSLAYRVLIGDENAVEIAYQVHDGNETHSRRQQVRLSPSWKRFEALGSWFACPRCSRRVEKLYLPTAQASFACRRCSRLAYTSTQVHDARVDRMRRDPRGVVDILSGRVAAGETEYALALRAVAILGRVQSDTDHDPERTQRGKTSIQEYEVLSVASTQMPAK